MLTSPFVLGLDLDECVAGYIAGVRPLFAERLGLPESAFPEPTSWDLHKSGWPIRDQEHFTELHDWAVLERDLFSTMPVIEGASEALWQLSDAGVHIRIITHRLITKRGHGKVVGDTAAWLERNNIPYRGLCFEGYKADLACDLYIDDSPRNILALRRARHDAICFDASSNRQVPGARAHNWAEVVEMVLGRMEARALFSLD